MGPPAADKHDVAGVLQDAPLSPAPQSKPAFGPAWKKTGRCAVGHAAPCLRAASSDATRTRGNARPNADRLVRSSKPLLRVRPPTGSLPENTDAMRVSRQGSGNSSLRSYKCVLATNKKKKGQNAALSGASTLEAAILSNNANSPKNDTRD